jgi:hypothetical protein
MCAACVACVGGIAVAILSCLPTVNTQQKLLDNLDDASAELMLADDDEPVRMRVGECFWGVEKTAAEEKLEALTEEAQQQYRQLEQQMAGGRRLPFSSIEVTFSIVISVSQHTGLG